MLEMTILETQIFNIFWESITPDILRTVAPTALVVPPTHPTPPLLKILHPPLYTFRNLT